MSELPPPTMFRPAFVAARVEPTSETVRVGPPWARRTRTRYSVVLEPAPVSAPQPVRAGFVPPPPPMSVLRTLWADDDDEAAVLACEVLEVANRRAAADAARLARVRTVRSPR